MPKLMPLIASQFFATSHKNLQIPVISVVRARVENSDHNEHMLKVRSNVLWCEWKCTRFLKHDGDNVVSNMPFSEELKQIEITSLTREHLTILRTCAVGGRVNRTVGGMGVRTF